MAGRRFVGGVLASLGLVGVLTLPSVSHAHPMGNFSVSHYSAIRVESDAIELRYLLDMAEIPTFQEIQETGIVSEVGHPSLSGYLAGKAETLKERLWLEVDGRRLELRTLSREVIFPPGAGGLPTMKLGFLYRATGIEASAGGLHRLAFRDDNLSDRIGWKEVIAGSGPGIVLLRSSVPETDRSAALSDYPTDLVSSPPQDLEARLVFSRAPMEMRASLGPTATTPRSERFGDQPAAVVQSAIPASVVAIIGVEESRGSMGLRANTQAKPRDTLSDLVSAKKVGLSIFLAAAVIAAGLGGLHALEPGHGKTVVAAYLVGSRGTAWHALVLGLTVTLSHTAGVYLLGGVTLYASRYVVPERLYPWLAALSGAIIAGMGLMLCWRRYAGIGGRNAHRHGHEHRHSHPEGQGHEHGPGALDTWPHHHETRDHSHERDEVSLRDLFALGVSGGMVPCPAALVVLLSAFSMRRAGFGLFLIVAFSVGLAAVLVGIGLVMVYARRFMSRVHGGGPLVTRWLPLTASAVVTILGVAITVQSLTSAGIIRLGLG